LRTAIKLSGTLVFIVENRTMSQQNAKLTLEQAYAELQVIKEFLDTCSVVEQK
jgi:hypothetical protein